MLLIAAVCSIVWSVPYCTAEETAGESTVEHSLKISPVPLNLQGKDRNIVAWGSYLVNAIADCGGCHTFPQFLAGGDPFQGTQSYPNLASAKRAPLSGRRTLLRPYHIE
jgi:hypothetical protein